MKINKTQKNIYTLSILSITAFLGISYIICIYKTVILASNIEMNNKNIELLSNTINQKEFDYIASVSDLDLDKAISLGYIKNTQDKVSYFDINNNGEFALR